MKLFKVGAGVHFLSGFGMRHGACYGQELFGDRLLIIDSPNLCHCEVHRPFPANTLFYHA